MQLHCTYCQTMFAIGREEKLIALQTMSTENLLHYDAYCPKCRRANRIARKRMELSFPGWQEAYKDMVKQSIKAEKEQVKAMEQKALESKKTPFTAAPKKSTASKVKPVSEAEKNQSIESKKKATTEAKKKEKK